MKQIITNNYYDILKEIITVEGDTRNVIDYQKLENLGFGINILITHRSLMGKTFGGKSFIFKKWREEGEKGIWVLNTETQLEKDILKFLSKHKKEKKFTLIHNLKITKNGIIDDTLKDLQDEDDKTICYFNALSTSEKLKGSRPNLKRIFIDEMNVGLDKIGDKQTLLIEDLISTVSDSAKTNKLRVYMFCNQKTLDNIFLMDLGITKINSVFTEVWMDNVKVALIYKPEVDLKKMKKKYSKNWSFKLAEITGNVRYSYLNQNIFDDTTGVIDKVRINYLFKIKAIFQLDWFLKCGKHFFKIYKNKELKEYYFIWLKDKPISNKIFCGEIIDLESGIIFKENIKKILLIFIQKRGKILFDSMFSKNTILKMIK